MTLLVCGILLWSVAHLMPSLAAPLRDRLAKRLGPAYQGLFALTILSSMVLMVLGWRSIAPEMIYAPPAWGRWAANGLMIVAIVLLAASGLPSNLKRWVRHPQLTGIAVWGVAHLLANGEQRSLLLFGALIVWSLVTMLSINRRDGERALPEPLPISADLKLVAIGIVGFVVFYLAHPYITGRVATPF